MDEIKKELKLQDELIKNRKKLKDIYEKKRLNLIGIQEDVSELLKPVIEPLKRLKINRINKLKINKV